MVTDPRPRGRDRARRSLQSHCAGKDRHGRNCIYLSEVVVTPMTHDSGECPRFGDNSEDAFMGQRDNRPRPAGTKLSAGNVANKAQIGVPKYGRVGTSTTKVELVKRNSPYASLRSAQ